MQKEASPAKARQVVAKWSAVKKPISICASAACAAWMGMAIRCHVNLFASKFYFILFFMTENIKDSFVKAINDRLSNPLLVAFCISWCFVNFNFFVALFKIKEFNDFIGFVAGKMFASHAIGGSYLCLGLECSQWVYRGIFLPACLSFLYVILSPFLRLCIFNYHKLHDKWLRNFKNYWDENFVVTRDEWDALRKEKEEIFLELDRKQEEVQKLREKIVVRKEQIDVLRNESIASSSFQTMDGNVDQAKKYVDDLDHHVFDDPVAYKVFEFICLNDGSVNFSRIEDALEFSVIELRHVLDILKDEDYIDAMPLIMGDVRISLTSKGNALAVRFMRKVKQN